MLTALLLNFPINPQECDLLGRKYHPSLFRERVIGLPEISTDGFHPYRPAIRDAFGGRVAHGVVTKTYSVTHLATPEASRRC
jgi:hypothetical protein